MHRGPIWGSSFGSARTHKLIDETAIVMRIELPPGSPPQFARLIARTTPWRSPPIRGYFRPMAPDDPDRPPDPGLSHVHDLAERLADEAVLPRPDWCAIARDARELAHEADMRCQPRSDD